MGVFTKKNRNEFIPTHQAVSQTVNPTEPVAASRLGKSLFLKGELHAQEEVLIEGQVEGSIKADGLVVIGKNGKVIADITAREVVIRGEVTGNVTGTEKVEIIPLGVLNGNIISQRVVLAEGAIFKGNIDMSVKDAPRKGQQDTRAVSPGPKVQSPESGK